VLLVLWDFHRKYPDACHPNRNTLARLAGISGPSVSNALSVLEDIGIVQTIHRPGPRANTYKLKWTELRAPRKSRKAAGSPYQRPRADRDLYMALDADGNPVKKYERRGGGFHRMSDGCRVKGQVEMVLHDLLVYWGVPHWAEVGYCALGIDLRYPKSGDLNRQATVDFVVAPGLMIECLGLAATQGSAKKYRAKAQAKMQAAREAGWTVLTVEPDQRPGDGLFEPITKAWATATVEDAIRLRRLLRGAGKCEDMHHPSLWLDAFIKDAKARLAGQIEPRKSKGLTVNKIGKHGFQVTYHRKPELVLMESAGRKSPIPSLRAVDTLSASTPTNNDETPSPMPVAPLVASEEEKMQAEIDKIDRCLDFLDDDTGSGREPTPVMTSKPPRPAIPPPVAVTEPDIYSDEALDWLLDED